MPVRDSLEIRELPRKYPESGNLAYLIHVAEKPFAFLHVTHLDYTLAWDGFVDFANLEKEVAESAAYSFGFANPIPLDDEKLRNRALASLVRSLPDDADELLKFHLADPIDYSKYRMLLSQSHHIAFARYDFSDAPSLAPVFSLIAENVRFASEGQAEVAVKLMRSRRITHALLEWIIHHHSTADEFENNLDLKSAVSDLIKVVSTGHSSS